MNNLSWLLYFADLAQGVSILAIFLAIGAGLAGVGVAIAAAAFEEAEKLKPLWLIGGVALGFGLVAAALPSRSTVMMIAASQTAQAIIETPAGQQSVTEAGQLASDSLKLLHKYVQDQLAEKSK